MSKFKASEDSQIANIIGPAPSTQSGQEEISPEDAATMEALSKKYGRPVGFKKETMSERVNLLMTPSIKAKAKARAAARRMSLNQYMSWLVENDNE